MDKKKDGRLVTWRQVAMMIIAAVGGIGLNAYRTYKTQGRLDATWVVTALITVTIIGTIFFFLTRHANRPEKEG